MSSPGEAVGSSTDEGEKLQDHSSVGASEENQASGVGPPPSSIPDVQVRKTSLYSHGNCCYVYCKSVVEKNRSRYTSKEYV